MAKDGASKSADELLREAGLMEKEIFLALEQIHPAMVEEKLFGTIRLLEIYEETLANININEISSPNDAVLLRKMIGRGSGFRLRLFRIFRGYRTGASFARDINMKEGTFNSYENGWRAFGFADAARFAEKLTINPRWLLDGKGDPFQGTLSRETEQDQGQGQEQTQEQEQEQEQERMAKYISSEPMVNIQTKTDRLVGEKDLPVYASAEGGGGAMILTYDQIETVKRPAPLDGVSGGFAIYITGSSMVPAYRPGDLALVHPHRPPGREDDVLVVTTADNGNSYLAMVKQLISRDDRAIKLLQHNPPAELEVATETVKNLYLIVGCYRRR